MDDNNLPLETRGNRLLSSIFAFLVLTLAFGLRIYSNGIISRNIDVIDFGDYTTVVSAISLLATFILVGSDSAMLKFMSQYFLYGYLEKAKGFLLFFLRLFSRMILTLVVMSAVVALVDHYDRTFYFHHYLSDHIVVKYLWLSPVVLFALFFARLLRALRFQHTSQLLLNLASRTSQILILLGMLLYEVAFTTEYLVLTFIASYFVSFILISIALKIVTPKNLLQAPEDLEDRPMWIKVASEIFVANFFFNNLSLILIVADKIFDPHPKNAGYLSLIVLISSVLWLSVNATQLSYNNEMQKNLREKNYIKLQKIVNEWCVQVFLISIALMALFYRFHNAIFDYFGHPYIDLLHPTLFFMLASLPALLVTPLSSIMIYGGHQKKLALTAGLSLIGLITGGGILIHVFSFWGALWSMLGLEIIAALVPIITLKMEMGILPYRFRFHDQTL